MNSMRTAMLLLLLAVACPAARAVDLESECSGQRGERCGDDRLAVELARLLSPDEFTLVATGNGHSTRAYDVASAELAWERTAARAASSGALRRAIAGALIESYLDAGLDAEAIHAYEALDDDTRDGSTRGALAYALVGKFDASIGISLSPQRLAADLAIAYAGSGRMEPVARLLERASEPVDIGYPDSYDGDLEAPSKVVGRCTRALLHVDARTDWFRWLFGDDPVLDGRDGCARASQSRGYRRLAAQMLARSDMPPSWRLGVRVEPDEQPGAVDSAQEQLDAALRKLPTWSARVESLRPRLRKLDVKDAAWLARQDDDNAGPGKQFEQRTPSALDRSLAATLLQRLSAPVYNPYRLERYTAQLRKMPEGAATKCTAVLCSNTQGEHWELHTSTDYDPTGEVPAAGFWLMRRGDNGAQPRTYYLGLKEHAPFELVEGQPLEVRKGRLRLFVHKAAIERREIMFPPLGVGLHRGAATQMLSATITDIARDSDGDGLTDLAEQQLLLDPTNPDSDGDGIPDTEDALPDVATAAATSSSRALGATLASLTHAPDLAISFAVPHSEAFVRRRSGDERTLFVVADPADFAGISGDRRIIVLPTSLGPEKLASHPSFSLMLPTRVQLHMLDEHHAELTYDAGWTGGKFALDLRDGTWRVGSLEHWIT